MADHGHDLVLFVRGMLTAERKKVIEERLIIRTKESRIMKSYSLIITATDVDH